MSLSPMHIQDHDTAAGADGTDTAQAAFTVNHERGVTRFVFTGVLTVHTLHRLETHITPALKNTDKNVVFDLTRVSRLDTAGALLLNQSAEILRLRGGKCSMEGADETQQRLLSKSTLPQPEGKESRPSAASLITLCNSLGKTIYDVTLLVGELTGFLGQFLHTVWDIIRRPSLMRWTSLVFHMEQVGLRAVPIVALLTFLIGLVVAYMGAQQLTMFGAQVFAVNLLEVTVLREMAVLITSIVVAGRSSSSFTAQIGAMVANEEVDALRSMGLDPNTLLVVPRVLALVFCLPMLVFLADIMALLGGAAALLYTIDLDLPSFITQLHNVAKVDNLFVGLVKTPFFAVSIGLVGCFQGFRATGSAESVGFLTTIAVVQSIFLVILFDALFAIFFMTLGI